MALEENAQILAAFFQGKKFISDWQPEYELSFDNLEDKRDFILGAQDLGFFVAEKFEPLEKTSMFFYEEDPLKRRPTSNAAGVPSFSPANLNITLTSSARDAVTITRDEVNILTLGFMYGGNFLGWRPAWLSNDSASSAVTSEFLCGAGEGDHRRFASLLGLWDVSRDAGRSGGGLAPPFDLNVRDFIRKAERHPPQRAEPLASAFAAWVFSLYGNPSTQDDDRRAGTEAEARIHRRRAEFFSSNDDEYLTKAGFDWRLIHCGLRNTATESQGFFSIPELSVRGQAMRASPDLLYRNIKTREVFIVEVKLSRLPVPSNLWPNVWAQLWCYSHINVAADAPYLRVIGEVWGERKKRYPRKQGGGWNLEVFLRASVRRNPRELSFDRFFRRLFDIYAHS